MQTEQPTTMPSNVRFSMKDPIGEVFRTHLGEPTMESEYRSTMLKGIREFRKSHGSPNGCLILHQILIQDALLENLEAESKPIKTMLDHSAKVLGEGSNG